MSGGTVHSILSRREPRAELPFPAPLSSRAASALAPPARTSLENVVQVRIRRQLGKATKQDAADALVDDVESPGIGAHTLDHGVNRLAETSA
jgi:hypothetical protein